MGANKSLDNKNEPFAGLTYHKSPKIKHLPKPIFFNENINNKEIQKDTQIKYDNKNETNHIISTNLNIYKDESNVYFHDSSTVSNYSKNMNNSPKVYKKNEKSPYYAFRNKNHKKYFDSSFQENKYFSNEKDEVLKTERKMFGFSQNYTGIVDQNIFGYTDNSKNEFKKKFEDIRDNFNDKNISNTSKENKNDFTVTKQEKIQSNEVVDSKTEIYNYNSHKNIYNRNKCYINEFNTSENQKMESSTFCDFKHKEYRHYDRNNFTNYETNKNKFKNQEYVLIIENEYLKNLAENKKYENHFGNIEQHKNSGFEITNSSLKNKGKKFTFKKNNNQDQNNDENDYDPGRRFF